MIDILKKEDCVGCDACVQRCPKHCISMNEDEQGFRYPRVNRDLCIDCHLCEKVCPVINQAGSRKPLHTYAARNKDSEVQRTSSSGGVFFALVEYVITEKQGVVFGARFNDKWEVVHDYAETLEDAKSFKGSKYVQSRIGDNFIKAENFLKAGRTVLFSGTPCQIAGLRLFLRKDYGERLILVDVVCHGVPSPLVWKEYLKQLTRPTGASDGKNTDSRLSLNAIPQISGISFRDKRFGWQKYGFTVYSVARRGDKNSDSQSAKYHPEERELLFETLDKNLYMQGFLKDLCLRPSCYECPAKCGKSNADITLADFWGIQTSYPELYRKGFYSLLLSRSEKGERTLSSIDILKSETNYNNALRGNPALEHSPIKPKQYSLFWQRYSSEGIPAIPAIVVSMQPNMFQRAYHLLRHLAGKILRRVGLKR